MTYCRVAHAHAVDADAGRRVHGGGRAQLGLDGGVQHGLLLLQVEHQAQLGQRQAGRPRQAEQRVVQVDGVAAQPPVMGGTCGRRASSLRVVPLIASLSSGAAPRPPS